MPCPFLIFSQSDYLIQIVDTNSHTKWQTVQIQISWLFQKPTDLDLHCLQRQGLSGFSRTRVKVNGSNLDLVVETLLKSDHGPPVKPHNKPTSVAQLDARPTEDQEFAGSTPAEVGNILSWRLIMKYFLRSFSPFRWFKKGSCQFLAKNVHNTG